MKKKEGGTRGNLILFPLKNAIFFRFAPILILLPLSLPSSISFLLHSFLPQQHHLFESSTLRISGFFSVSLQTQHFSVEFLIKTFGNGFCGLVLLTSLALTLVIRKLELVMTNNLLEKTCYSIRINNTKLAVFTYFL